MCYRIKLYSTIHRIGNIRFSHISIIALIPCRIFCHITGHCAIPCSTGVLYIGGMCENGRTTSEVLHFNMFGLFQAVDFNDKDSLSIISRSSAAMTPCSVSPTPSSSSPSYLNPISIPIPSCGPSSQLFDAISSSDRLLNLNHLYFSSTTDTPPITQYLQSKNNNIALYSPVQKWSFLSKDNDSPYGLADGENLDEKYDHTRNILQKKLTIQKLENLGFNRTYSTVEFV